MLFLIAHDLRQDMLGGSRRLRLRGLKPMPNLCALRAQSLSLNRHYAQFGVCAPSRTSLLTGRRPDSTRVHNLVDYWREVGGDFMTIPQWFLSQGYTTLGAGLVFHNGHSSGGSGRPQDARLSWSRPPWPQAGCCHANASASQSTPGDTSAGRQSRRSGATAVRLGQIGQPDTSQLSPWSILSAGAEFAASDVLLANHAVHLLRRLSREPHEPFLLAVGFKRPHLPFEAPQRAYARFPPGSVALLPPGRRTPPTHLPPVAAHRSAELRGYRGGSAMLTSQAGMVALTRGYLAAASFMDEQVCPVPSAVHVHAPAIVTCHMRPPYDHDPPGVIRAGGAGDLSTRGVPLC